MHDISIKKFILQHIITIEMGALAIFILIGWWLFKRAEGRTFFEGIYYTVMMITTIGLGDYIPLTTMGKILTMLYGLTGVPIFIIILSNSLEHRFSSRLRKYLHDVSNNIQEFAETVEEKIEGKQPTRRDKIVQRFKWH